MGESMREKREKLKKGQGRGKQLGKRGDN